MSYRALLATIVVFLIVCGTLAQRAELPRVPRGFDEGRTVLAEEAGHGLLQPGMLVERLLEEADLRELAEFVFLHCSQTEKAKLDELLRLDGQLVRQRDADGVEALFKEHRLRSGRIATRIGDMLESEEYTLTEVVAWLYARGFNYRVLQWAMNGERMDPMRRRTEIRRAVERDRHAGDIFELGFWTLNLSDGRDEPGGHYDGVQLVEALMTVGFSPADFAAVMNLDEPADLSAEQLRLIQWGDPVLVWQAIKRGIPESELARDSIQRMRRTRKAADVAPMALARAGTIQRWFRTGGPGVVGVYEGPWPDSEGNPQVPMGALRELEEAEESELVAHLDGPVGRHFEGRGSRLTLVLYEDGSARAMLRQRNSRNFGHGSPTGNARTDLQMYEGRISLRGSNGLLYPVFKAGQDVTPPELDLVNVNYRVGEALLTLDYDDGLLLTPMMLRRTSRLIDAP
jgi:hypothetical protein